MPSTHPRREAERLFLRLRGNALPRDGDVIEVVYSERFSPGKCIIGVIVPMRHLTLSKVKAVTAAHGHDFPPAIINSREKQCLRLAWRCRDILPEDTKHLRRTVRARVAWAEQVFGLKAIPMPVRGRMTALRKLRAFS